MHRAPETYGCLDPKSITRVLEDPRALVDVPGIAAFGDQRVLDAAGADTGARALWELLHEDAAVHALRGLVANGPAGCTDLGRTIFGAHDIDVDLTMSRLIDAASSAREISDSTALLPARYHVFLRSLNGIRICFNSAHGHIGDGVHSIGRYYFEQRDLCDCGYGLWELLVCGDCASWYLRDCCDPGNDGAADDDGPANSIYLVGADDETDDETKKGEVDRCLVCRLSSAHCGCQESARRLVVDVGARKTCLSCNSDNVGRVMTGTMGPTQVLAEVLTRAQDPDPRAVGRGTAKKLLTFSDSRNSAAQFAAQFDRAHRQHVSRAGIYRAVQSFEEPVGIDELASRVAKVLREANFFKPGPQAQHAAKGLVFAEFTASYASRRRLTSLGLAASSVHLESEPSSGFIDLAGSRANAIAITQALLEIMQYDSAVTKGDITQLSGYVNIRGDVFYGYTVGTKRWISPGAPLHQRRRNRLFNLASRIVGEERADELLAHVWKYALDDEVLVGWGNQFQIDVDRLIFFRPETWYRCTQCRRVTPFALTNGVGCATRNCSGRLEPDANVVALGDHYTRNVIEPIEYLRIEEHTAQLDNPEAQKIGKEFREGKVNILSCSTTFELGVDIGTLQTVFMRNVPPTVANYRQRAGRAGRTRQGAAFLVTYCGPTPHDQVFFQNPKDIITGSLSVPSFNVDNALLRERHINSLLLGSLWQYVSRTLGKRNTVEDFLLALDVQELVNEWVTAVQPILDRECERYLGQNNRVGVRERFALALSKEREYVNLRLDELRGLLEVLSAPALSNAMNDLRRLRERRIIEHLSARAFLPSYAFPIYTVELRTPDNTVNLQRDLEASDQ